MLNREQGISCKVAPRVDTGPSATHTSPHIRPLAVRPLTYPEGVPNPWGFFISALPGSDTCEVQP